MPEITTRAIPVALTYDLRDRVLNQGKQAVKPGDDAPDTLHVAAYDEDGQIVGIASIYHEPPPDSDNPDAWRLRGMATLPAVRGRGYGAHALQHCIDHVAAQGGNLIWCNVRENAVGFYRHMGFQVHDTPYELPGHGKRYFATYTLQPPTIKQEQI